MLLRNALSSPFRPAFGLCWSSPGWKWPSGRLPPGLRLTPSTSASKMGTARGSAGTVSIGWPHRLIPFGSRVCFMRSLTYTKEVPKFGAKAIPG
eukprot:12714929-Alexandrium_andersonii.AAC.1